VRGREESDDSVDPQTSENYQRPTWPNADGQPDDVRVMPDPAGHPFCLYTGG
jgi:hypothetical protein